MKPSFSIRQLAATAALSAAAGYFVGSACEPMTERIIDTARRAGAEERCTESQDPNMSMLMGLLAHRAARKAAPALRSELGAGAAGEMEIQYAFTVGRDGAITLSGAEASCNGGPCPGESELPEMIGVLIASEWTARPPASGCSVLIRVEIPPIEGDAPPRRIRIPAGSRSVEL